VAGPGHLSAVMASGSSVPGDQLDGDHRAAAAHVTDDRVGLGELVQPGQHDLADPAARRQVLGGHGLDGPQGAAQATGFPP